MKNQKAKSLRPGDAVYFPIAIDGEATVERIKVVEVSKRYVFFPAFVGGTTPDVYFRTDELGTVFFLTEEEALEAAKNQIESEEEGNA